MDNRDFKLLDKAVTGLIAGQQEMSHGFRRTNELLRQTTELLMKTVDQVADLTTKSEEQEDRYRELLDVLRTIGENSADTQQRLARVEARLDKLEEAG